MYSDLSPDGIAAKKIVDAVLKHYQQTILRLKQKLSSDFSFLQLAAPTKKQ